MTYTTARAGFISAFLHSVLIAFILTLRSGPPVSDATPSAMHVQLLSFEQMLGAPEQMDPVVTETGEQPSRTEPMQRIATRAVETKPAPELPKPEQVELSAEQRMALSPRDLRTDSLLAALARVETSRNETLPVSEPELNMLSSRFSAWTPTLFNRQPDESLSWRHQGQDYKATLKQMPAENDMASGYVVVEVSTEQNGARYSTELRMKQLSFSNFAQFVDRWNPNVQIHRDEIDGRFHSNSDVNVSYTEEATPVFHGRVTTTSEINMLTERPVNEDELFQGGLETGVHRIAMPRHVLPLSGSRTVNEEEQVHRLTEDARVIFYPDGTYTWQYVESGEPERTRAISEDGHYIIGEDGAELHLKGVVRGKVLVYSPDVIVIDGDLTYSQYPKITAESDDYLGIVSDLSVEIAEPEVVGPGDLVITASIYAKRRFAVRNYEEKEYGTLLIYGSVTAGSVTATEPRFATKVEFDERLEDMRPPGFPLTDRYELEEWDGEWTKEEDITAGTTSM